MAWCVKSKNADGTVNAIPCQDRADIARAWKHELASGRNAWLEDANGKRVEVIKVDEAAISRGKLH